MNSYFHKAPIFIYKQESVLKFLYDNNVTVALEF